MIICEGGFNPLVQEYARSVQSEFIDGGLDVSIRSSYGHPPVAVDTNNLRIVLNVYYLYIIIIS